MSTDQTILFFGQLAEVAGTASVSVKLLADTNELDELLKQKYPQLQEYVFLKAINNKVITGTAIIPAGAVIALLPPFSGG